MIIVAAVALLCSAAMYLAKPVVVENATEIFEVMFMFAHAICIGIVSVVCCSAAAQTGIRSYADMCRLAHVLYDEIKFDYENLNPNALYSESAILNGCVAGSLFFIAMIAISQAGSPTVKALCLPAFSGVILISVCYIAVNTFHFIMYLRRLVRTTVEEFDSPSLV
jgi:hypothetical protein